MGVSVTHPQSGSLSNVKLECGNVRFCGRRKTRVPGEKPSKQGQEPTTNSTNITPSPEIEPGPHSWEVSGLTTVPSLLPIIATIGRKQIGLKFS